MVEFWQYIYINNRIIIKSKNIKETDLSSIDVENKRFSKYSPLITLLIMLLDTHSNLVSVLFETFNILNVLDIKKI